MKDQAISILVILICVTSRLTPDWIGILVTWTRSDLSGKCEISKRNQASNLIVDSVMFSTTDQEIT